MEPALDRRFEILFEQSPFSLQLIAADGRTLRVNQAWRDLWQLGDSDRGLRYVLDQYNIFDDAQLAANGTLTLVRRAFAGESVRTPPHRYDASMTGRPGRVRWVVAHMHPVRDEAGQASEIVLMHEDVTEQVAREGELRASEKRLQQLANTIPQLAWMASPDGNIHWFNDRWYAYTGTTPGQVQETGWAVAHHPDWRDAVLDFWNWTLSQSEPVHITFPLRAADGTYRTFLTLVAPLKDEHGRVTQWFGTNTDVTPLETAEEGLRRTEERLRLATDAGNIGIWEWNLANDEVSWSDKVYALHGLKPGQFGGRAQDFQKLVHPEDLPALWERVEGAIENLDGFNAQFRVLLPSGGTRWLSTWARLRRGAQGAAVRLVGATISIDDQKRAEMKLREGERRKDEFLAMLAHELRNPIAPIASAAELLALARVDDPRVRLAAGVIDRQVRHLTKLVDDLIDVSRVTRGLIRLEPKSLDLVEILRAAVEQVRPLIDARAHTLSLTCAVEELRVRADPTRVLQVFTNLLNNAAKYTPDGGAIEIAVIPADAIVRIEIRDNGQGIESELLTDIFEPFTQGSRAPDRSQGGLGIGLTLVKQLIDLHQGTVEARSAGAGRGSVFVVTLPLPADHVEAVPTTPGDEPKRVVPQSLILVDDNVDAADVLAAVLRSDGHDVSVFYDAASVLEARLDRPPFACILDIGLPDMDGYELVGRLKKRSECQSTRFIALTGYGQTLDRLRSRVAGFDHHLVKPVELETLQRLLSDVA